MPEFTHLDGDAARMVDISGKNTVFRKATASGTITLRKDTITAIEEGTVIKGNVLATARVATVMAVKNTAGLIPMCHPIPVSGIDIGFTISGCTITARVSVTTTGQTGVEMEALVGVSTALLTIWDMVKSAEKDENGQYPVTGISGIVVEEKIKG